MSLNPYSPEAAAADFERARFEAALRHVLALLTRTPDELLSYEEVAQQLRLSTSSERGVQAIPVAAIVGSVGRAKDFTRSFLPRRAEDRQRWSRVRNALLDPNRAGLPAIDVYRVGEAYFVLDGNHRVSVARREGIQYIEAHVIEIQSPIPFTPDMTAGDLICHSELVQFLDDTGLGDPALGFDFRTVQCGQYPKLRQQIAVRQVIAGRAQRRELTFRQAAADWLAAVYAPLVRAIRQHNLLEWFPNHTETDLYLWVSEHQQQLQEELGWAIRPDAAIANLAVQSGPRAKSSLNAPGRWQSDRLAGRYLSHLFNDILVPVNDTPASWNALEQALVLAEKEQARLQGLHLVRRAQDKTSAPVQSLQARFLERCAQANVVGELAVETGNVARKICERAILADLIVLAVPERAPQSPLRGLLSARGSDTHYILKNAARPVLAASRDPSPMRRALVVFDGSTRAQQVLFIAAYMGEIWKTALTVLVVPGSAQAPNPVLAHAQMYLELHELEADFISQDGTTGNILNLMLDRNLDVLLLGQDHTSPRRDGRERELLQALLREPGHAMLIFP